MLFLESNEELVGKRCTTMMKWFSKWLTRTLEDISGESRGQGFGKQQYAGQMWIQSLLSSSLKHEYVSTFPCKTKTRRLVSSFSLRFYENRKWAGIYSFGFNTSLCKSDHFSSSQIPKKGWQIFISPASFPVGWSDLCSYNSAFNSRQEGFVSLSFIPVLLCVKLFVCLFRRPLFSFCLRQTV